MLQQTFSRLSGLDFSDPVVICNEAHRFVAAEQIRTGGFRHSGIILESVGRNTAPAITLAALNALKENPNQDPILLVLAADHHISDVATYQASLKAAVPIAEANMLVTFGITPTAPETGYGYIKQESYLPFQVSASHAFFNIERFVEKPDKELAQEYLDSGMYYWNSGMFMFKASQYLHELKTFRPDIFSACTSSFEKSTTDLDFIRVDPNLFEKCPSDSIDYAVMENTSHAVVTPLNVGWNDIGSWSALWDVSKKDKQGNVCQGDVIAVSSNNNYVHSENKLVATVGIDNLIVVETKDSILVAHKKHVQDVKEVVNYLDAHHRSEHKVHREVYRPWGKYDVIDSGSRDKVKRITVNAGHSLSLQMHHHRAEHWVVVAGIAQVQIDDQTLLISEDQSTYIPLGKVHSLKNPGLIPLEMIEVQTGTYLGEDDIVRFQDHYGREQAK